MHPWTSHAVLLTWTLLATLTVLECQGTDCRPARPGAPRVQDHVVGTFPSRQACEAQGSDLARTKLPAVTSISRPGITIHQTLTYRCEQGG